MAWMELRCARCLTDAYEGYEAALREDCGRQYPAPAPGPEAWCLVPCCAGLKGWPMP